MSKPLRSLLTLTSRVRRRRADACGTTPARPNRRDDSRADYHANRADGHAQADAAAARRSRASRPRRRWVRAGRCPSARHVNGVRSRAPTSSPQAARGGAVPAVCRRGASASSTTYPHLLLGAESNKRTTSAASSSTKSSTSGRAPAAEAPSLLQQTRRPSSSQGRAVAFAEVKENFSPTARKRSRARRAVSRRRCGRRAGQ